MSRFTSHTRRTALAWLMAAVAVHLVPAAAHAQTAYSWGRNDFGQLGDGTITMRNAPVAVSGLTSGVTAVSGGSNSHSLAIQDGAVRAWGFNGQGQLGDGTTTQRNAPVAVSGLTSGVSAVSAGGSHSLAIRNGEVYAWGFNGNGQLGDGTLIQRTAPVAVSGLTFGVIAVSAGDSHSLAIQDGAAKAWGYNGQGQLGDGTTTQRNAPVAVSGLTSGVTAVSTSSHHSLAIQDGAAKAWGFNGQGQLGDGTLTNSSTPVAVSGLTSGVSAVSAGGSHSLAIRNGEVYAWGDNNLGQLGDGTATGSTTPVLVTGGTLPDNFTSVAAGDSSSYALTADHRLFAWGDDTASQLGNGAPNGNVLVPTELLAPTGFSWNSLEAGREHVIATLVPVPEPATVLAVGAAGLGLAGWVRRKRRPVTAG